MSNNINEIIKIMVSDEWKRQHRRDRGNIGGNTGKHLKKNTYPKVGKRRSFGNGKNKKVMPF